jgi:hypothetical protein
MKLTKENFNKVFDYIDEQANSTSGEFDEETNIVDAVERTVEMFKEISDDSGIQKNLS